MLLNIIAIILIFGIVNCTIPERETRIVNGEDAVIGDSPYMVSIRFLGKHMCGGTIINEFYILTAGHCPEGLSAEDLSIQYGVDNIEDNAINVINVKKFVIHEKYDPSNNFVNDIAVLELENPIILNELNAKPVILPKPYQEILLRTPAIAIGWGLDKTGGEVQKQLQSVKIFAYTALECFLAHGTAVNTFIQICAGVFETEKGICNGDSGGPLIVRGYQAGIVSWSYIPCATKGPGVYVKVSHYIDWIKTNTII